MQIYMFTADVLQKSRFRRLSKIIDVPMNYHWISIDVCIFFDAFLHNLSLLFRHWLWHRFVNEFAYGFCSQAISKWLPKSIPNPLKSKGFISGSPLAHFGLHFASFGCPFGSIWMAVVPFTLYFICFGALSTLFWCLWTLVLAPFGHFGCQSACINAKCVCALFAFTFYPSKRNLFLWMFAVLSPCYFLIISM